MNDYDRIAQVIRYIDTHYEEQPGLEDLAAQVGLSPFHFHRLFSDWAGVTPKEFLRCLTFAHARQLLARGRSVLDSAVDTGLSGPGRLHDLCVSLEAASPGEVKSGGKGLLITYGFTDTPFGVCLVGESARGISHMAFVDDGDFASAEKDLRSNWPKAELRRDDETAGQIASNVFCRPEAGAKAPLRAYVRGSEFQVRVWSALLKIPAGSVTTYGKLAVSIDRPSAARAVGTAVGSNWVGWLIPCHRVIRETGVIGGYRWGSERKRAMLIWESAMASGSPALSR